MIDVAFDARVTSHMSVGMRAYVTELRARLPSVAPDLRFAFVGTGDNFDVAEQAGLPLALARARPRLVHFPTPYVPVFNLRPFVLTIHDLIELRFPAFAKRTVAPYFRYAVGPVARRARAVLCDDPKTVAELERFLSVDPARVRVVPLGVGDAFLAAADASEAPERRATPYVFYAGNHRGHKDLPTLAAAWAALPPDLPLDVCVTGPDDLHALRARYSRPNGALVALGDLSASALVAAYRGALAYVHPALIEGFGLPMLEAAVLGVPIIASETSVPAPLAAGSSRFPPGDANALARLLERIARDPASARATARRLQPVARALTWDRCAAATAAVYRDILKA